MWRNTTRRPAGPMPPLGHNRFLSRITRSVTPTSGAAIADAMAHAYLYGPSPTAERLLDRNATALANEETVLLPFIGQLLVPVVAGDVALSHWLLCVLARHADVGGILEDASEAFLLGAALPTAPPSWPTGGGRMVPYRVVCTAAPSPPHSAVAGLHGMPTASSVALLVGHLHRYATGLTSESPLMAQVAHVRLLGLCSLRYTSIDTLALVREQLAKLSQPIPSVSLIAMLALAPPAICHTLLDFQQACTRRHWEGMEASDATALARAAPLLSHTQSFFYADSDVAAIWKALLSNDHFFLNDPSAVPPPACCSGPTTPSGTAATMHSVLMRCVANVPVGSVVHHSNPQSSVLGQLDWTALLNKTSRVYLKRGRGSDLYVLHRLLLSRFAAVELRMPPAYATRLVGALFDEALNAAATALGDVESLHAVAWERMLALTQWALRLFRSQNATHNELLQLCRKAAMQFEPAVNASRRLLQLYEAYYEAHCPALAHDKDAFQQLLRHVCLVLSHAEDGALRPLQHALLAPLMRYLEMDVTVKHTWLLDAAAALLSTVDAVATAAAPQTADATHEDAKAIGVWLVAAVHERLLPARNVTGINLLAISSIRRVLERIGAAPKSLFWWRCGCGAENPAGSMHCSACLRRDRRGWCCTVCAADQPLLPAGKSSSRLSEPLPPCCQCGATHPRLAAGALLGYRCCPTCKGMFDADAGDCPACDAVRPRMASDHAAPAGPTAIHRGEASTVCCAHCGKAMALNAPVCPHCKTRNMESNVKLWHCSTCHNYSYSTWSRCQRCPPESPTAKPANALTIPFFLWTCGCGAPLQHPCRLSCSACSGSRSGNQTGGGGFTCTSCHQRSHCRNQQQAIASSLPLQQQQQSSVLVTTCQHCHYPHPRDAHILTLPRALSRCCLHCGHDYVATTGTGMGPQVCTACMRLQPINPNTPFQCDGTDCALGTAKQWQYGLECRACGSVRRDVRVQGDAFVWKCVQDVAPPPAAVDGVVVDDVNDATNGTCGTWNVSWVASCRGCDAARPHAPDTEVRAKLLPWTCGACHTRHPATTVLICDACDAGLQPQPEPCVLCGLRHVSWHCPTTDQLVEAERLLSELEADAFEAPPAHATLSW